MPLGQAVLLVGAADGTDLFIRALERDRRAPYRVIGILSLRARQAGRRMQGHLILGTVEEAEAAAQAAEADEAVL
jgi:O-antigen biosynthesis protein WbqV